MLAVIEPQRLFGHRTVQKQSFKSLVCAQSGTPSTGECKTRSCKLLSCASLSPNSAKVFGLALPREVHQRATFDDKDVRQPAASWPETEPQPTQCATESCSELCKGVRPPDGTTGRGSVRLCRVHYGPLYSTGMHRWMMDPAKSCTMERESYVSTHF